MGAFKDLKNQKFGRLTILYATKERKNGVIVWKCICDCGNLAEIRSRDLINGSTKSCGCLQKEKAKQANIIHGDTIKRKQSRLYRIWASMKTRCSNSKDHGYKYYGGRRISVCDGWKDNYQSFKFWALLNGYKKCLTIDRINHNGNYEPSNCQWITRSENARKAQLDRRKQ